MTILLSLFSACMLTAADPVKVQPDTGYQFSAPVTNLAMYDKDGRIHEDGLLNTAPVTFFRTRPETAAITYTAKEPVTMKPAEDQTVYAVIDRGNGIPERSLVTVMEDGFLQTAARGYLLSEYLPLTPETKITDRNEKNMFTVFYYDSGKNFITYKNTYGKLESVPDAVYFRIFAGGKKKIGSLTVRNSKFPAAKSIRTADKKDHLVYQGKPAASIILNGWKSDLMCRFAAYELRHWVKTVTGAELPVFESAENVAGTKIFISAKRQDGKDDIYTFRKDQDGNWHITGENSRGALFGTFRFIEENLGLIWARPQEYGTVFEPMENVPVCVSEGTRKPAFRMRSWSMPGGVNDNEITNLCYARNGANSALVVIGYGPWHYLSKMYGRIQKVGGGFMYGFLSSYKQTNPEFFPLLSGNRKLSNHAQPCFTNPDVVAATVKEAMNHLANAQEGLDWMDCSNEDTWECCECERCLAPIKLPDGTELKPKAKGSGADPLFRSTQLYQYLNSVVTEVNREYPDLKLSTLAYIFSAEYPAIPVNKNIISLFAPYPTHNMRFPLRDSHSRGTAAGKTWAERFKDWCGGESPLAFYEYFGVSYFNAMSYAAAENLRDLKHKAKNPWGINSEAAQDVGKYARLWDVNAINMWVITKLMWDPDQNVDELRKEFIRKTYREAAPQMQKFWDIIAKHWNDPELGHVESCHSGPGGVFQRYIVQTGSEKELRNLLKEADAAVKNPRSKQLIGDLIKAFDSFAAELGRVVIPLVPESATEAHVSTSPHWEKAVKLDNFLIPRQNGKTGKEKTVVSFMHDGKNLYVRFACSGKIEMKKQADADGIFPKGEHVELQFRVGRQLYFLAAGPGSSGAYTMKNWDRDKPVKYAWCEVRQNRNEGWGWIMAIPFAELGFKPENELKRPLEIVLSRFCGDEESTYKGVIPHGEHIWTPLNFN